jgi:hypothetical protein
MQTHEIVTEIDELLEQGDINLLVETIEQGETAWSRPMSIDEALNHVDDIINENVSKI